MRKSLFLLLITMAGAGFAQDQLFKKDNTKLEVKILEINPSEIKYKLFTYQDGPTISVAKKDVALIIYQNGVHEVINTPEAQPAATEVPYVVYNYAYKPLPRINQDSINKANFDKLTSTKNTIFMNMLDPVNGCLNFSYFREFAKNSLNVYAPVSFGFTEPMMTQSMMQTFNSSLYNVGGYINNFKFTRKVAEAGIGIHFQTSGNKPVTHFIGPYFGMAQFNGTFQDSYNTYYYNPTTGTYSNQNPSYDLHGFVMNRYYYMLDNGILFRVSKHFNMMMLVGIGYRQDVFIANDPNTYVNTKYGNNHNYYTNFYSNFPINAFKCGFSFGYRF
ncbi:MAG: hypothetical protein HY062_10970 [Bacteroidetes bacterium]|nr:hypothetical protein [Bacteroidota bacterium]